MSGAVDRRELALKAMAGLIGAAIGWLPVELASHGHSLTEVLSPGAQIAEFATMAVLAGMIGGMIVAAEGKSLAITPATRRAFIRGFLICLVVAIPANYYSDEIFTWILQAGGWGSGQAGSEVYVVIGRLVGWTLMGLMLGVGVGLASLSLSNVLKGGAGGWVGGFIGGLGFDLIGNFSRSGLLSRLIGFCVIGVAIGFFIGLVQELTKAAWISVEAGRLRGRQFRVEGATTMIGRAEENPVGLFGDGGVQPRHAVIERRADGYTLKNLAVQAGTLVNGSRIETAPLHDGDRIRISDYELAFHERAASQAARLPAGPAAVPVNDGASANRPAAAVAQPPIQAAGTGGGPCLLAVDGTRFNVKAGATTQIGRALDNDIVVNDASVSRHHANIETRNGAYVLRDLGSQNGSWLSGQRVTEAPLDDGDAVKLGDAVFTFHA